MSTWKRMAVVSLFVLTIAPAAFADEESVGGASDGQATSARPASVDARSSEDAEQREIHQLHAQIEQLQAEVAASLNEGGRQYLEQNLRPWR